MLDDVSFLNFKRFESESFTFKPMTILAGRNGSGKTSVIHGLLLAQAARARNDGIAELNGPYGINLGWFDELINERVDTDCFCIEINQNNSLSHWTFTKGSTEMYANASSKVSKASSKKSTSPRAFQYLAAERFGPRITQQTLALPSELLEVGVNGEYSAQVIDKLGNLIVDKHRIAPVETSTYLLKAQTELWLSQITRPVEIDTAAFSGTSVVSLSFRTPGSAWVRPTNMGFGLSYSLPIILAALTAPKGGLLIVENPEAHLHPAGQSAIGAFLAQMAASGVQIILETHSDHVLNGIRRSIGELGVLDPQDAIVHFFDETDGPISQLKFDKLGGISKWPKGFFDQYQLDISKITRILRPR